MSFSEQITAHSLVNAVYDETFAMQVQSHFPLEIIYCTSGTIKLEYVNDKGLDDIAVLTAHQFLIIRPRVTHIMRILQKTKLLVLELAHDGKDDICRYITSSRFASTLPSLKNFYSAPSAVTVLTDNGQIERTLKELISLAYKKRHGREDEFYEYDYDLLVKKLLIEICRASLNTEKARGNKYVTAALNYIYGNFNKPLSLKNIAEFVNVTPPYLQSLFKEAHGKTVISLLIDYRIYKAQRLLTETDNDISQIARQVGYTDPRAFLSAFTTRIGLSPTEYRKKHRSDSFIRDFNDNTPLDDKNIENWINTAYPPPTYNPNRTT